MTDPDRTETELEELTREWREAAEEQLYWANKSLRLARRAQAFAIVAAAIMCVAFVVSIVRAVWL